MSKNFATDSSGESTKRKRDDHSYSKLWSGINLEEIQSLDEETFVSVVDTPENSTPDANIASGSTSSSSDPSLVRRPIRAKVTDSSSLLELCPLSMRVALEKTKAEWSKLSSGHCLQILDQLYHLTDSEMAERFIDLFDQSTSIIEKVRKEKSLSKRKERLMEELYQLLLENRNWRLFDDPAAAALSEPEKRHTAAMIFENLLAHLLTLTTSEIEQSTCNGEGGDGPLNFLEEQAVYYVGGFLIRKLMKKISPASPLTTEVHNLFVECVANESTGFPIAAEWTAHVDRGGLVFITPYCYDLFLAIEKCARSSLPYKKALDDVDVDANAFRIAASACAEYSDEAQDMFRSLVVREFYDLRGKAVARKRLEDAILNDELLQERRGLRSKHQRLETSRMENK